MGNLVGHHILNCSAGSGVKVVHPDGVIELLPRPIQVAQLMLRYPEYYIGPPSVQKNPRCILAADEFLESGNVYYLVPAYMVPPENFHWRKSRHASRF